MSKWNKFKFWFKKSILWTVISYLLWNILMLTTLTHGPILFNDPILFKSGISISILLGMFAGYIFLGNYIKDQENQNHE